MLNKGLWKMSKKRKIIPKICLIDSNCKFSNRKDGKIGAHIMEWGYNQILGVGLT